MSFNEYIKTKTSNTRYKEFQRRRNFPASNYVTFIEDSSCIVKLSFCIFVLFYSSEYKD